MSAVREATADRSGDLRNYTLVTGAYWADTITDGAARMLVLFYFYERGYCPLALAALFLFYEIFGIVTNLVGGWLAARLGLKATLTMGLAVQLIALASLALVPAAWLVVPYVMATQALSGIAKDLTKMSSKSAMKLVCADRRSRRALQLGRGAHGLQERAQGRRVLRRGPPAHARRIPARAARSHGPGAGRARRGRLADARRPRRARSQGAVRADVLEQSSGQPARRGPPVPLRLPRRLVRDRAAGLPAQRAGLELLGGRHVPRDLGDRLRRRAGRLHRGCLRREPSRTARLRHGSPSCSRRFRQASRWRSRRRGSDPGDHRAA